MKAIETQRPVLESIARRAHYLATQMIYQANHRSDKEKGDPKIGGHPSACASALHIMGALHLIVRTGFDHIANKPHAAPTDHSYHYLLDLFLRQDGQRLSQEEKNTAMMGLRKFSHDGEPVFQSYHSAYDCDHHNFFPSGTVGIPPVMAGYLALAYRFARDHGYKVPDAHFWAVAGDSEFREGSMHEAIPDFAEREIGNLTWIIDYNRQSLDGHRITNKRIMGGTDAVRLERTMQANGWEVIQLQHGSKRRQLFARKGGQLFKKFLESDLEDYEFQALLLVQDMAALKKGVVKEHPDLKEFLQSVTDQELFEALHDLGGHDIVALAEAMLASKKNDRKPTFIIAHTLKGWGLQMAGAPGNHSALPNGEEIESLRQREGLSGSSLFAGFSEQSKEGLYLRERGEVLYKEIREQEQLKAENLASFKKQFDDKQGIPISLEINTKMASYPHTQWMLGQLTAKLTRIANTSSQEAKKPLTENEKPWKVPAELLVSMAPDVGTSTNLNPAMDGKIFGAPVVEDFETEMGVKDDKLPDLVPGEEASDRFLRFEIAESNVMSCAGSFGKMRDIIGVPLVPLMTVYDFFIKRALDQYFYNLYWGSSFILVGTPSGVTLSPEGAQHGWKSDIQIPNQVTWEPFFCQELDWIFCETVRRHINKETDGRNGVLIRGVTRGIEQKEMLKYLRTQARFKVGSGQVLSRNEYPMPGALDESQVEALSESEILETIRQEVLQGAYPLVHYAGYAGYEPGDNVVHIFAMGSPTTEALKASEALLKHGIYANVYVVTSPDLLCGIQGHENDYAYLTEALGVKGDLFVRPTETLNGHDLVTVAGRQIPIVSVHDGEPGLLDNLGSIIGVKQLCLAVRKHSRSGRPAEIYAYHHIDAVSVVEACGKVLASTALEDVKVSQSVLSEKPSTIAKKNWKELWNTRAQH